MTADKAGEALDHFYQIGYDVLNACNNKHIKGLFVSDCGILYCINENYTREHQLQFLLDVIKSINRQMLQNELMLTSSIAYGTFEFQERSETPYISKSLMHGSAYLNAFLDNENGTPKINPGQCRIIKENLPDNIIENINQCTNFHGLIKQKNQRAKHYYYYWMVSNENQIEEFEVKYKESDEWKYKGMKSALGAFHSK